MVRSVVAEESQIKPAEERLFVSGVSAQVGLVVGKLSAASDRALVYGLIPTPPTDGGAPPCSLNSDGGGGAPDEKKKGSSKGGKSSAEAAAPSLVIDGDWVAEHARQVSRMLLGGMYVIGIYLWAPEATSKATPPLVLAQTIRAVLLAESRHLSDLDEGLIIHFSYSPRLSCRICALKSGTMRPCDMKMGKLLTSLQLYRCMYNFQIRLPVYTFESKLDIKSVLHNKINSHTEELRDAKVLIDGELMMKDHHNFSEGSHDVEFLLPIQKTLSFKACSSEEVAGFIVLSGTICASSYLGPKEPISQAISDLKGDIINSLRSRLDIITDEVEDNSGTTRDSGKEGRGEISGDKLTLRVKFQELSKPLSLSFPRRVFVTWLSTVFICDYLQPSENFEDLKNRFTELISMQEAPTDASDMLEPEAGAVPIMAKSFWNAIRGAPPTSPADVRRHLGNRKTGDDQNISGSSHSLPIPLIALLFAVLVGAVALFLSGGKKAEFG